MYSNDVFDEVIILPSPDADSAIERLVGLDEHRQRLVKEVRILLSPTQVKDWNKRHHKGKLTAVEYLAARPPLFVLSGDVGTGKTVLARSFGSEVARQARIKVKLFVLSLSARGAGTVGQMTQLIASAFAQVREEVSRTRDRSGRAGRGVIMLIDEADALAQSRETDQMHHEDRAGVNSLIRGIDGLAGSGLPAAVLMCTNRLSALDPAVRRRAAVLLEFDRPNEEQRIRLLRRALDGSGFSEAELSTLAAATGQTSARPYAWTYSDIVDRLIPALVLDAFPEHPLDAERALEIAGGMVPTPPFKERSV